MFPVLSHFGCHAEVVRFRAMLSASVIRKIQCSPWLGMMGRARKVLCVQYQCRFETCGRKQTLVTTKPPVINVGIMEATRAIYQALYGSVILTYLVFVCMYVHSFTGQWCRKNSKWILLV